jgi:hypothetical protein
MNFDAQMMGAVKEQVGEAVLACNREFPKRKGERYTIPELQSVFPKTPEC